MDNFALNVTARGRASLELAIQLAFANNAPGGKITHYAVREPRMGERQPRPEGVPESYKMPWRYAHEPRPLRLIFFWTTPEEGQAEVVRLPFSLDAVGAADFAERWLAEADYGKEPDHDGDNKPGWCTYVEGWGHVDSSHYAVVAISPAWAMYGK